MSGVVPETFHEAKKIEECIWGHNYNNRQWNLVWGFKKVSKMGGLGQGKTL